MNRKTAMIIFALVFCNSFLLILTAKQEPVKILSLISCTLCATGFWMIVKKSKKDSGGEENA